MVTSSLVSDNKMQVIAGLLTNGRDSSLTLGGELEQENDTGYTCMYHLFLPQKILRNSRESFAKGAKQKL